jgi:signal recognition particle receptor subunit beta
VIVTEGGNEEAIQIYDTPGRLFSLDNIKEMTYDQEHYLSIGDGFLLVYDITSKASFDLVKVLRQRIILRYKEVPVIIVGNKYDLDGIRQVTFEKAMEWARHFGINIYETSVLDRDSLRDPFTYITWSMANPGTYGVNINTAIPTTACPLYRQTTSFKRHHLNNNNYSLYKKII